MYFLNCPFGAAAFEGAFLYLFRPVAAGAACFTGLVCLMGLDGCVDCRPVKALANGLHVGLLTC